MLFHSCRVTRHVCSPPSRQIQKRRPLIDHRRASQGRHDRQGPLEPVEDPAVREVELARRQAQPRPGHREPGSPPSLLAAPTSAPPLPSGAEASSGQLAHLFTRCATKRNAFTLAILIAYALTRFGVPWHRSRASLSERARRSLRHLSALKSTNCGRSRTLYRKPSFKLYCSSMPCVSRGLRTEYCRSSRDLCQTS